MTLLEILCVGAAATAAKFPVGSEGGGWWRWLCPDEGELLLGVECETGLLFILAELNIMLFFELALIRVLARTAVGLTTIYKPK